MSYASSLVRFRPALWFAALALLIVGFEHAVTTLPVFRQRPVLPLAVAFDLLVFVPALFYFMVVRRYQLPLSVVVAAVGACLALTQWLIPAAQAPRPLLQFLPAGLEALTLVVFATRGRRLVRAYRTAGALEIGFVPRLRAAIAQEMGLAGHFLLAETDMLQFALTGWWSRPVVQPGTTAFSSHRESGFPALVVFGCFGLLLETAAVHLLARHWSHAAANWLLLVDLYGLALLLAHGHAVRLQPTLLTAEAVFVRVGFFWQVAVPRAALVAVEPVRGDLAATADTLNLAKLLFTAPNLLLTFAQPVEVAGPYGLRRTARRVAVYLDAPQSFIAAAGYSSTSLTR